MGLAVDMIYFYGRRKGMLSMTQIKKIVLVQILLLVFPVLVLAEQVVDNTQAKCYEKSADTTFLNPATVFYSKDITILSDPPGDINGDHVISLKDAILGLQIIDCYDPGIPIGYNYDINNDRRVGLEEVIYALQVIIGIR